MKYLITLFALIPQLGLLQKFKLFIIRRLLVQFSLSIILVEVAAVYYMLHKDKSFATFLCNRIILARSVCSKGYHVVQAQTFFC